MLTDFRAVSGSEAQTQAGPEPAREKERVPRAPRPQLVPVERDLVGRHLRDAESPETDHPPLFIAIYPRPLPDPFDDLLFGEPRDRREIGVGNGLSAP